MNMSDLNDSERYRNRIKKCQSEKKNRILKIQCSILQFRATTEENVGEDDRVPGRRKKINKIKLELCAGRIRKKKTKVKLDFITELEAN